ncbi:MAG: hypothetical protein WA733_12195 [Methylocystis sp.]
MSQDNMVRLGGKRFPGLAGSGGGGDSGGTVDMEPRVAVLEAHVGHIKEDMSSIKVASERTRSDITEARIQLGKLEQHVSHLPGKGFIVITVLVVLGVLGALIIFQQQIQRLLGLH